MGLRFRKSFKILPGIKINLSKGGVSTTIGTKGASINIGRNGTYGNVGIPGTGISYREKISSSTNHNKLQDKPVSSENFSKSNIGYLFIFTIGGLIFFSLAITLSILALYSFIYFFIRFYAQTKPVYSSQPIYKADRRFKSGQRLIGSKLVKTGSVPLNFDERLKSKKRGYYNLGIGIVLTVLAAWLYFI